MFSSMFGSIVIGSFLFWVVTFVLFCIVVALVENDKYYWPATIVILYVGVFLAMCGVNALQWVVTNPVSLALIAIAYLFVGTLWSIFKWFNFVRERFKIYRECRWDFLKGHGVVSTLGNGEPDYSVQVPEKLLEDWHDHSKRYLHSFSCEDSSKPPLVTENTDKISTWIVYWPFSVVWFLLSDIVQWVSEWVVMKMKHVYRRATTMAWTSTDFHQD